MLVAAALPAFVAWGSSQSDGSGASGFLDLSGSRSLRWAAYPVCVAVVAVIARAATIGEGSVAFAALYTGGIALYFAAILVLTKVGWGRSSAESELAAPLAGVVGLVGGLTIAVGMFFDGDDFVKGLAIAAAVSLIGIGLSKVSSS